MIRFKEFLLEHDMDKTWSNFGSKIHARMKEEDSAHEDESHAKKKFAEHIKSGDPTPTKKYGKWIAQRYGAGGINKLEDIPGRTYDALEKFHSKKHLLAKHGINPDINAHKTLPDLEDAVDKLPKDAKSSNEKKAEVASAHAKDAEHHEDEHWTVKVPHTQEASCHYGKGTRWCTAANRNNMFKEYHKDGKLHIFIPKKPKYQGEKYQLHVESQSFMDHRDESANLKETFKDRPSDYLHGLIKKAAE